MKNNKQYSKALRINYENWKKDSLSNTGYFIIFKGFKDTNKLKNISGNAMKLYVYLGLNSNNLTGEVWHSNATIAKYFDKSERTIRLWMQELESLNLIKRLQINFNEESHTFLQGYSNLDSYYDSEKYAYRYRLKDLQIRKLVDLNIYEKDISRAIKVNFKKAYVQVKKEYFEISSYAPIQKVDLKNINKILLNEIPEFYAYMKKYNYLKSDGSIGEKRQLFERVRVK